MGPWKGIYREEIKFFHPPYRPCTINCSFLQLNRAIQKLSLMEIVLMEYRSVNEILESTNNNCPFLTILDIDD